MGVYMFMSMDQSGFLEIGKAGVASNSRFLSHHYNPNESNSNLAKSLLIDPEMMKFVLMSDDVGVWVKQKY